jgi:hypothetical protein
LFVLKFCKGGGREKKGDGRREKGEGRSEKGLPWKYPRTRSLYMAI